MGLGAARLRIAPRRGAAARVLSRRNAGKSSWRRAVSKSSQVGIRRLDGDSDRTFAISGWVTIALNALCVQDWPECYSTMGFAGPFNVCGAVTA